MYGNVLILIVSWTAVDCTNYQRYAEPGDARYATPPSYSRYSTVANPYSQYPLQSEQGSRAYGQGYLQTGRTHANNNRNDVGDHCVNRSPQQGISIESLMGMWYGVDYLQHVVDDSSDDYPNTCLLIHISEPKEKNMKFSYRVLPYILFLITSACAEELDSNRSEESTISSVTCVRDNLYDHLDIKEVSGEWKVRTVYMHLSSEGVTTYNTYTIVTIREEDHFPSTGYGPSIETKYHVKENNAIFWRENRRLRVLWEEAGLTIDYSLYFRNESAGYWRVSDKQNGGIEQPRYQLFSGSIQVLKATNDLLLLNFCQESVEGKPPHLYSVLLSRKTSLIAEEELNSVHELLQNKNLSVASRRIVCKSSADRSGVSSTSSFILLLLAYTMRC
ncbi:uncharacterized protein LOC113493027 [Trichoplusia ni]|uniref:Uncharacterized protein LOC113493027 n=1 Tax=Trichoplusia ni TaxID=7111 RepID=A0A7E5VE86_TRINI|nr:uncharacterized protein LOC113493027 [Trichoplusia ni]